MNQIEFTNALADAIRSMSVEHTEVDVFDVRKNNGLSVRALAVRIPGRDVSPAFPVDFLYELHQKGVPTDTIAAEVLVNHAGNPMAQDFSACRIDDWNKVKDSLRFRVINYEKNKEWLAGLPHRKVLDLARIYYLSIEYAQGQKASITIDRKLTRYWGVSEEELEQTAEENTRRFETVCVEDLTDMMNRMAEEAGIPKLPGSDELKPATMFVITNGSRWFGAYLIADTAIFRDLALRMDSDLVILPSSIHELLAVAGDEGRPAGYFRNMVEHVNSMYVADAEILSDSVYYYDRKTEQISVIR